MAQKKVILLNWDYTRKDLLENVIGLNEEFEVYYLFDYEKKSELKLPGPVVYWNQFSDPEDLLEKIKPYRIVFHDIESFHQIALNIVARKKGIRTYILEHGLRRAFEVNLTLENERIQGLRPSSSSNGTLRFFWPAVYCLPLIKWPAFIKLMLMRKYFGLTRALKSCQYEFRQADIYINFTKRNAGYIIERDNIPEHKLVYVGNTQFDAFFRKVRSGKFPTRENKLLLIDSPLEHVKGSRITLHAKMGFIKKIAEYCKENGLKLAVKLHPISQVPDLKDESIELIREADFFDLIFSSSCCVFIHNSGLIPLSMLYCKTVFFNAIPELNIDVISDGLVPVLPFENFKLSELKFKELNDAEKQNVIDNYFFATDGRSAERLNQLIAS